MSYERPQILVIDPHPILREGIVAVLSSAMEGSVIVGSATFPAALDYLGNHPVELVISGFSMHGETVLPFLKELKNLRSSTRVLILTSHDEIQVGYPCIRAGASGVVRLGAAVHIVLDAIRAVLAGNHYISEQLSTMLMKQLGSEITPGTHLTASELRVFAMIGECLPVSSIATQLGVSVKTVEAHREHIKHKLGCKNAAMVTAAAVRWLASPPFMMGDPPR